VSVFFYDEINAQQENDVFLSPCCVFDITEDILGKFWYCTPKFLQADEIKKSLMKQHFVVISTVGQTEIPASLHTCVTKTASVKILHLQNHCSSLL
jgi:hypothetical protein